MQIKIDNKIILEISETDLKCLKNDLLDFEDWLAKAALGKLNKCRKRLIREWQPKLMADPDVETIPANEEGFLNLVFSRSDYKDRAKREEETEKEIE
ncbi:unnamed protein product [marine sediment metagenome]|uniref:Uncharacterized protein n=1 Tax=marine sediment metagenome TaxID=412755 RepID=X1AVA0_9ZZZZ